MAPSSRIPYGASLWRRRKEGGSTMKITKIDTFFAHLEHRNLVYVKVHTDEGIHGIGEA
jgi:hypothetical protein